MGERGRPARRAGGSAAFCLIAGLLIPPSGRAAEGVEHAPGASAVPAPGGSAVALPDVLVTATLTAEEPEDLPYTTSTLEEEYIRHQRAARTLPQVLAEVPAVSVQQTAFGQESPYIRGFTGFRTLLLVDGVRVNNATFRDGPNQYWGLVDPLSIARVEVVKGPSSVLYGSDAIGGTVNALTMEDFPEGLHPGGYYRYGSAEDSHTARLDMRGLCPPQLGWTGGATWRDYGDLLGGRDIGVQEKTNYDALSGDAKVMWRPSPTFRLTTAFQSMDQFDAWRTHSTIYGISFEGTTIGTDLKRELDQTRRMAYVRAEVFPEEVWLSHASLTLSYQLMTEQEDRVLSAGNSQIQGYDDNTGGASLIATSPSAAGTWTYGAEWYGDWVDDSFRKDYNADGTIRAVRPRGAMANDARYDSVGVFVQDEVEPVERLTVIAGARYNWFQARAAGEDIDTDATDAVTYDDLDESYQAFVGSGRALYKLTDQLKPFIGVSQGFRAPNLSDLTRFDVARSGEQEMPATDLDPERYVAYEGGLRARWASWGGAVSYYFTTIDDMIIRYPTGETTGAGNLVVTKDNVGDGYLHGVEVALDWNFYEGFTAFGTFSWMDGRVDTYVDGTNKERKPVSRISPTQWLLGVRWTSEDRKVWVEGTGRIALEEDRLSPEDELDTQRIPPDGTPGYYLLGIRGGVRIAERVNLFAGVENITDQDYRVHGSGVNGPGTNFVGGVEIRW
jgi:hemoglobin/transferrin/lactoferrin receptor protein